MRKIYALQSILIALITFFCVNSIHAELILSENFNYDLGTLNVGETPATNNEQWFSYSGMWNWMNSMSFTAPLAR